MWYVRVPSSVNDVWKNVLESQLLSKSQKVRTERQSNKRMTVIKEWEKRTDSSSEIIFCVYWVIIFLGKYTLCFSWKDIIIPFYPQL